MLQVLPISAHSPTASDHCKSILDPHVHPLQQRLSICSFAERQEYQTHGISHLVTISNPGSDSARPAWFGGDYLELQFGDVISEADARQCRTIAPQIDHVRCALNFVREATRGEDSRILVSCDYGASRSTALAYLFLADQLGAGHEAEAFNLMLDLRPIAVPNGLVVRLGDTFLNRGGALLAPLKDFNAKLYSELFGKQG